MAFVDREPDHARRDDRDDDLLQHVDVEEALPVEHDHGEDRAELDDDLEALEELGFRDAERMAREDQVRRGGDGRNSVIPSTTPRSAAEGIERRRGELGEESGVHGADRVRVLSSSARRLSPSAST
jgi:hypothetical protein